MCRLAGVVYTQQVSITFTGLTGEGHNPLDPSSLVFVDSIEIYVTAISPRVRQIGTGTIPQGVWHAGEVGIGWFGDDPSGNVPDVLGPGYFITAMQRNYQIFAPQTGGHYYGTFWWRLVAGVTIDALVIF